VTLNALESAVLDTLLSGDHPALAALRNQLTRAEVHSREFSGAGFFTRFAVPAGATPVDARLRTLGDAVADIEGLTRGAGFTLFLQCGVIDMLEGFSYDEPWPKEVTRFIVRRSGKNWDLESFKRVGY
jgi:hypothetical protein